MSNTVSISDTQDLESEGDHGKFKKNQDAMVIEYCPRIFRELRTLDEYNAEELD
jgi:hypothetical protein